MKRSFHTRAVGLGLFVLPTIVYLALSAGCRFGLGGAVQDIGPASDSALLKATGLDARGAEEAALVRAALADIDASQEETNTGTQGDTTVTGDDATIINLQAIGGGSAALLIAGLGAVVVTLRRKSGDTTEALDRIIHAIRKGGDEGTDAARIRKAIRDAGCMSHPTRGHVYDRAEAVIRDRLDLIKVASR